jgi:hypothetical protein
VKMACRMHGAVTECKGKMPTNSCDIANACCKKMYRMPPRPTRRVRACDQDLTEGVQTVKPMHCLIYYDSPMHTLWKRRPLLTPAPSVFGRNLQYQPVRK